jgi:hypothetical protein
LIRYFKPEISNYHNKIFGDMKLLHQKEGESCKKLLNLDKFDNKDNFINKLITGDNEKDIHSTEPTSFPCMDNDLEVKIKEHIKNGKPFRCNHIDCNDEVYYFFKDYNAHCHSKHPKYPIYPNLSLIEQTQELEPKGNPWE